MSKTLGFIYTVTLGMLLAFFYFTVGDMSDRAAAALDLIGLFIKWLGVAMLVWLVIVGVVSLYALYTKFKLRSARPVDGAFPLQRRRVHVWPANTPFLPAFFIWLAGKELLININTMVGSAAMIDTNGFTELEPAAGWDRQVQVRQAVEVTNRVRAAFPGDAARMDKYGAMSHSPRSSAGLLREVKQPKDTPMLPGPVAMPSSFDGIAEGQYRWAAADVLKQNTDTAFALGLTRDNSIVSWDILASPHVRVHGASQKSGKTNVIKTIALGVVRSGGHAIVLDRRQFKDWGAYLPYVECIDSTAPGALVGTLAQVSALYRDRDRLLGAAGVGNVGKLGQQRIFLLISEFGSACRMAEATGELDEVVFHLKNIMSEAAAAGVHVVFEDQVVNGNWPRELRGNAAPICGYLPEDTSKAGGYSKAHSLGRYQFYFDGARFRTFDMNVEAAGLLRGVPASAKLIDPSSFLPGNTKEIPGNSRKYEEGRKEGRKEIGATELQGMIWEWRDSGRGSQAAFIRYLYETTGQTVTDGYVSKVWRQNASGSPVGSQSDASTPTELTMLEKLRMEFGDDVYIGSDRLGIDKTTKR